MGMLLALSQVLTGCAALNRPVIHALPNDFVLLDKGQTFTPAGPGAWMSSYFMCRVMAVDVGDAAYCKDVK